MFCPKCKSEYRSGFVTCADCKVPLVPVPPPELHAELEEEPKYIGYKSPNVIPNNFTLLMTFNSSVEAALASGRLKGAGIKVHMISNDVGTGSGFVSSPLSQHAIYVKLKDVHLAKELLKAPNENNDVNKRDNVKVKDAQKNLLFIRASFLGISALFFLLANAPRKPGESYDYGALSIAGLFIFFLILTFAKRHKTLVEK